MPRPKMRPTDRKNLLARLSELVKDGVVERRSDFGTLAGVQGRSASDWWGVQANEITLASLMSIVRELGKLRHAISFDWLLRDPKEGVPRDPRARTPAAPLTDALCDYVRNSVAAALSDSPVAFGAPTLPAESVQVDARALLDAFVEMTVAEVRAAALADYNARVAVSTVEFLSQALEALATDGAQRGAAKEQNALLNAVNQLELPAESAVFRSEVSFGAVRLSEAWLKHAAATYPWSSANDAVRVIERIAERRAAAAANE